MKENDSATAPHPVDAYFDQALCDPGQAAREKWRRVYDLHSAHPERSGASISREVGLCRAQIYYIARKLGFCFSDRFASRPDNYEAIVRREFATMSTPVLARMLGVPRQTVTEDARRWGLKKSEERRRAARAANFARSRTPEARAKQSQTMRRLYESARRRLRFGLDPLTGLRVGGSNKNRDKCVYYLRRYYRYAVIPGDPAELLVEAHQRRSLKREWTLRQWGVVTTAHYRPDAERVGRRLADHLLRLSESVRRRTTAEVDGGATIRVQAPTKHRSVDVEPRLRIELGMEEGAVRIERVDVLPLTAQDTARYRLPEDIEHELAAATMRAMERRHP